MMSRAQWFLMSLPMVADYRVEMAVWSVIVSFRCSLDSFQDVVRTVKKKIPRFSFFFFPVSISTLFGPSMTKKTQASQIGSTE